VFWGRLGQHSANGTVLAVILPIAVVGTLVYYFGSPHPQVDLRLGLLLVTGGVFGAYVGARAMARLPAGTLKLMLAGLLVVVGVKELVFP